MDGSSKPQEGANSNESKRKDPPGPITAEGDAPQKRFYRQRAHCNPLSHNDSFQYPISPDCMDWKDIYVTSSEPPTVLDIGCGFGGLTLHLAQLLPDERVLGMEIRAKVTEFVRLRIVNFRQEQPNGHDYQNCGVHRTNSMKFLVNYFAKASLNKLFFCFPDPHFKRKNFPRRIISTRLLSEYAYVLRDYARLYCITDVAELHEWHIEHLEAHPLFRRVEQVDDDPCVAAMQKVTEEGQKVERNGGNKHFAVYERIPDNESAQLTVDSFFS